MAQSGQSRHCNILSAIGQERTLAAFEMAVICYFESGDSDLDTKTVRSFSAFNIVFVGRR
jgi:hypothetical protein